MTVHLYSFLSACIGGCLSGRPATESPATSEIHAVNIRHQGLGRVGKVTTLPLGQPRWIAEGDDHRSRLAQVRADFGQVTLGVTLG